MVLKLIFQCTIAVILMIGCNDSPYMQGKGLYIQHCQNCHMEDGSGLSGLIPPLSASLIGDRQDITCIIVYGRNDTIFSETSFLVKEMPGFPRLSTTEVSNIVNYINHKWNPDFKESTILEIQDQITNCVPKD